MGKRQQRVEVFDALARYYPSEVLSLDELSYWISFSRILGIGPARFKRLLDFFAEDVAAAWQASAFDLSEAGLDAKTIESFLAQRTKIIPATEIERLERLRIQVITWKDAVYPPLLRKIEYPPPVLYICGRLTEDDLSYTLGVVGTRKMSTYGRQVTEQFTRELVKGKMTIVSGLALGVDTVAHTTALDHGGRTIAVMASGLDVIYPPSNLNLAKRIVESGQGALLTAFPLGVNPEAGNFPARNHVISGLSLGVLVTEAPQKSGALVTAGLATSQGREVFAIPQNIFSPSGAGVNRLICDGAHPVTTVKDIFDCFNVYSFPTEESVEQMGDELIPDNEEEKAIYTVLTREPTHIDDITRVSALPPQVVSATLTILELKGIVKQVGSMQYVRGN